ncbi:MAG TPA: FAD-dependent oxidoreductase, partial [Niabella sp.]|nr:FAD-dependent oxidoreductase [Niabella sp.]
MKVIVIGNGMVGQKFCEKLLSKGIPDLQITVFGEETLAAYDRVHLSSYFAGKTVSDLTLQPVKWYQENGIELRLGDPVQEVDREHKTVRSFEGISLHYDYLVFATGSSALVPPIPGVDKEGVFVYRTIEDLNMIWRHAPAAKTAAVIGGGLLGLEAAKACLDLGIKDTHIIEFAPRLMPRQIDEAGSDILVQQLKELNITTHTGKNTAAILGNEAIRGMIFTDGSILSTDMLIISAGIKPRDELARACGLPVGPRGGIVVNDEMCTSDSSVFAIGECALHHSMIYGLVAPGYEMADVAASRLAGTQKLFHGFDLSTKLKLIGVDVASFGDPFIAGEEAKTIVFRDNHRGIYKRINFSNDGKELLGGILVGDADAYNMLLQVCKNKMALPPDPMDLIIKPKEGGGDTGAGVLALPDDALICSCEGVTKLDICNAVTQQGCETVDAIKKCTKAATGCGG